ncbi:hypothetical protein ACFVTP_37740 [Streptomyces celluloflavus]
MRSVTGHPATRPPGQAMVGTVLVDHWITAQIRGIHPDQPGAFVEATH